MNNKEWACGFNQGYYCAVATMVEGHGLSTEAEDAIGANYHTIPTLIRYGVERSDIDTLRPIIKEVERKRKLNKQ